MSCPYRSSALFQAHCGHEYPDPGCARTGETPTGLLSRHRVSQGRSEILARMGVTRRGYHNVGVAGCSAMYNVGWLREDRMYSNPYGLRRWLQRSVCRAAGVRTLHNLQDMLCQYLSSWNLKCHFEEIIRLSQRR
jgi:hypothetical protein